jgi:hypothetical protein
MSRNGGKVGSKRTVDCDGRAEMEEGVWKKSVDELDDDKRRDPLTSTVDRCGIEWSSVRGGKATEGGDKQTI